MKKTLIVGDYEAAVFRDCQEWIGEFGMEVQVVSRSDATLKELPGMVDEHMRPEHQSILCFGLTYEVWSLKPLFTGMETPKVLFPNDEFHLPTVCQEMESIVAHCKAINPACAVYLAIPCIKDIYQYNQQRLKNTPYARVRLIDHPVLGQRTINNSARAKYSQLQELAQPQFQWTEKMVLKSGHAFNRICPSKRHRTKRHCSEEPSHIAYLKGHTHTLISPLVRDGLHTTPLFARLFVRSHTLLHGSSPSTPGGNYYDTYGEAQYGGYSQNNYTGQGRMMASYYPTVQPAYGAVQQDQVAASYYATVLPQVTAQPPTTVTATTPTSVPNDSSQSTEVLVEDEIKRFLSRCTLPSAAKSIESPASNRHSHGRRYSTSRSRGKSTSRSPSKTRSRGKSTSRSPSKTRESSAAKYVKSPASSKHSHGRRHSTGRSRGKSTSRSPSKTGAFDDEPPHKKMKMSAVKMETASEKSTRPMTMKEGLKSLRGLHEREVKMYRKDPETHPEYYKRKRTWERELEAKGLDQDDVTVQMAWKHLWQSMEEVIFKADWKMKKEQFLKKYLTYDGKKRKKRSRSKSPSDDSSSQDSVTSSEDESSSDSSTTVSDSGTSDDDSARKKKKKKMKKLYKKFAKKKNKKYSKGIKSKKSGKTSTKPPKSENKQTSGNREDSETDLSLASSPNMNWAERTDVSDKHIIPSPPNINWAGLERTEAKHRNILSPPNINWVGLERTEAKHRNIPSPPNINWAGLERTEAKYRNIPSPPNINWAGSLSEGTDVKRRNIPPPPIVNWTERLAKTEIKLEESGEPSDRLRLSTSEASNYYESDMNVSPLSTKSESPNLVVNEAPSYAQNYTDLPCKSPIMSQSSVNDEIDEELKSHSPYLHLVFVLKQICEKFGSFTSSISSLYDVLCKDYKAGKNLLECFDNDAISLFAIIREMLKELLVRGDVSIIQKAIYSETLSNLCDLFEELHALKANQEKSEGITTVDINKLAEATHGKNCQDTLNIIKETLQRHKVDSEKINLMDLYITIKKIHATSIPDENSANETKGNLPLFGQQEGDSKRLLPIGVSLNGMVDTPNIPNKLSFAGYDVTDFLPRPSVTDFASSHTPQNQEKGDTGGTKHQNCDRLQEEGKRKESSPTKESPSKEREYHKEWESPKNERKYQEERERPKNERKYQEERESPKNERKYQEERESPRNERESPRRESKSHKGRENSSTQLKTDSESKSQMKIHASSKLHPPPSDPSTTAEQPSLVPSTIPLPPQFQDHKISLFKLPSTKRVGSIFNIFDDEERESPRKKRPSLRNERKSHEERESPRNKREYHKERESPRSERESPRKEREYHKERESPRNEGKSHKESEKSQKETNPYKGPHLGENCPQSNSQQTTGSTLNLDPKSNKVYCPQCSSVLDEGSCKGKPYPREKRKKDKTGPPCDYCGKLGHSIESCYSYLGICPYCKQEGHRREECGERFNNHNKLKQQFVAACVICKGPHLGINCPQSNSQQATGSHLHPKSNKVYCLQCSSVHDEGSCNGKPYPRGKKKKDKTGPPCGYCGKFGHSIECCYFYLGICPYCKEYGHRREECDESIKNKKPKIVPTCTTCIEPHLGKDCPQSVKEPQVL